MKMPFCTEKIFFPKYIFAHIYVKRFLAKKWRSWDWLITCFLCVFLNMSYISYHQINSNFKPHRTTSINGCSQLLHINLALVHTLLYMMTSLNGNIFGLLAICAGGNWPVTVNSPHKGQWRGALMSSLICTWINGCVNNLEAGDLRRNSAHYDVTVMIFQIKIINGATTSYLEASIFVNTFLIKKRNCEPNWSYCFVKELQYFAL